VIFGYSRPGFLLRRRTWDPKDPAPAALTGRTVLVTGASSGLGTAAATAFAELGAAVILVVRDEQRGSRAAAKIRTRYPDAELSVLRCDLSDLDSVTEAAGTVLADNERIDVMVHNAGVLPAERAESRQGHELTLATHVLGPLLLTELLRPALRAAGGARVIVVSSGGMYTAGIDTDEIESRTGRYSGARAYARTKRLQVAFAPRCAGRLADDDIAVHVMHPGWADTPGISSSLPGFHRLIGPILRTPDQAVDTVVWLAATDPAPPTGLFWHDRRSRPTHLLPWRHDKPESVDEAWDYCRAVSGIDGP
jgi:NAD(P)-dependent dehydrogenase (short-subunit alcohol dehydrogenase family)